MQKQVHPVHFEDYSGNQFERLCFAYLVSQNPSADVSWYGQLGGDGGRDIVVTPLQCNSTIVQCANYRRLIFAKAEEDLQKIAGGQLKTSAEFLMIVGGSVSAQMRDKVEKAAKRLGFLGAKIWSGSEFEEFLRCDSPSLLKRFVDGEAFPELPAELRSLASESLAIADQAIVDGLIAGFNRPAMRTPFYHESSIPRFEGALIELIELVNTGKTPQGAIIPSKRDVKDASVRKELDLLVEDLVCLRASYDRLKKEGEIRPCGCQEVDCSIFMSSPKAIDEMDKIRRSILKRASELSSEVPQELYHLA